MLIKRLIAVLMVLTASACSPVDALKEGLAQSQAVSDDLEKSIGVKSFVGFNWNNGTLTSVNVHFMGVPSNLTLTEIVEKTKASVSSSFKQTPKQVVVAFVVAG